MNKPTPIVVLCPPMATGEAQWPGFDYLAAGFAAAREALDRGEAVYLVADGCTVAAATPDWARDERRLTRSELGDYRLGDPIARTRPLAMEVKTWLDRLFAPACEAHGVSPGEVFYASCAGRMLQPLFHALPFVEGLAEAFPTARFHIVGPPWLGAPLLATRLGAKGGVTPAVPMPNTAGWRIVFALRLVLSLVRAVLGQVRNFLRTRDGRGYLCARAGRPVQRPRAWIGLVPDWGRINHHVIDRIARPLIDAGIPVGAILISTLASGERTTGARLVAQGTNPWPAMDSLFGDGGIAAVTQLVRPARARGLVRAIARGAWASIRVGANLLRKGPWLDVRSEPVCLVGHEQALADLATIDVMQVAAVAGAFEEMRNHDVGGTPVVFASVGLADTAMADRLLSRAGATTFNFLHGALGDMWSGQNENMSDVVLAWTKVDAQNTATQGSRAALLPAPRLAVPRRRGRASNVLLITNHLHHDWRASGYPLRPFLHEMLGCAEVIDEVCPGRFTVRWRPHPSDVEREIEPFLRRYPMLERSTGQSLHDDIDWADIVIASPSTTMLDVLDARVPMFVQTISAVRNLVEMRYTHSDRRFLYARDIAVSFRSLVDALDGGDPAALEPERVLREAVLGEAQAPADVAAFLQALVDEQATCDLPERRP